MNVSKNSFSYLGRLILLIIIVTSFLFSACENCGEGPEKGGTSDGQLGYLKVAEPPDVNKASHGHMSRPTCWMATAANMLAAAGYAKDHPYMEEYQINTEEDLIYRQMLQLMAVDSGFVNSALEAWLIAHQAKYPNNLYRWPHVVGELDDPPPGVSPAWQDPEGPKILGILMRECNFVAVGLYSPENSTDYYWAHAVNCWGDEMDEESLEENPETIRVTDSNIVGDGKYDEYTYDDYYSPDPDNNVGEGWYLNYPQTSHPYIKHFYVLSELEYDNGDDLVAGVVGEYMLTQSSNTAAESLDYQVASDTTILKKQFELLSPSYTSLPYTPVLKRNAPKPTQYDVNWDLRADPILRSGRVIASTLVVLPLSSPLEYKKVRFTHGPSGETTEFPGIEWYMATPFIENAGEIQDVTGGYVIGHFEIYKEGGEGNSLEEVGEYRFVQQYRYNQRPEKHTFVISGTSSSGKYKIKNLKFGHSYGLLTGKELWNFNNWKSTYPIDFDLGPSKDITVEWPKFPYPRGLNSTK